MQDFFKHAYIKLLNRHTHMPKIHTFEYIHNLIKGRYMLKKNVEKQHFLFYFIMLLATDYE